MLLSSLFNFNNWSVDCLPIWAQRTTAAAVTAVAPAATAHTRKLEPRQWDVELCHCRHCFSAKTSSSLYLPDPVHVHLIRGRYSQPWQQGNCKFLGFWFHQIGGGLWRGLREPIKISTTLGKISVKTQSEIKVLRQRLRFSNHTFLLKELLTTKQCTWWSRKWNTEKRCRIQDVYE